MDRQILEAELDVVLDSMVRVTINGAQQFTEKKRQFLMKVSDSLDEQRELLRQAAQALNKPGATLVQTELRQRILAHLTPGENTGHTKGPGA